jgi:hypothetical protein
MIAGESMTALEKSRMARLRTSTAAAAMGSAVMVVR